MISGYIFEYVVDDSRLGLGDCPRKLWLCKRCKRVYVCEETGQILQESRDEQRVCVSYARCTVTEPKKKGGRIHMYLYKRCG